ncbi:hypothetical protein E2320_000942 [Naja naja]|nr:hypothetical protein E2320_000942 [Naja naja]
MDPEGRGIGHHLSHVEGLVGIHRAQVPQDFRGVDEHIVVPLENEVDTPTIVQCPAQEEGVLQGQVEESVLKIPHQDVAKTPALEMDQVLQAGPEPPLRRAQQEHSADSQPAGLSFSPPSVPHGLAGSKIAGHGFDGQEQEGVVLCLGTLAGPIEDEILIKLRIRVEMFDLGGQFLHVGAGAFVPGSVDH